MFNLSSKLLILFLTGLFFFLSHALTAQGWEWEREGASFGVQLKPIVPNDIFRIRGESATEEGVEFQLDPLVGYKAGAIIRFGIHRRFTMETGINYVRRPYLASASDTSGAEEGRMRVIAYDIPIAATYYVRLSEHLYLSTSAGLHLHFLPSNLFVRQGDMSITAARRNWFAPAASARTGFEYRTRNSGYFFVGPEYRFFFQSLYITEIEYRRSQSSTVRQRFTLDGAFFGIILRYTFSPGE